MPTELLIDCARFFHILGFALGIGAGTFADFSILRKLNSKITDHDMSNLEIVHKIVWFGVGLLWFTGLILLYSRTGFIPSEFTPKLIIKLLVVSVLTINAVLLGKFAVPLVRRNVNRPYLAFPLEDKTLLCLLAALSVGSWLSGLMLGVFSALKPAQMEFIIPFFGLLYGAALFGALMVSILMHIVWERQQKQITVKLLNGHASPQSIERPKNTENVGNNSADVMVMALDRRAARG